MVLLGSLYVSVSIGLPLYGEPLRLALANWIFTQLSFSADRAFAPREDALNNCPPTSAGPAARAAFFIAMAAILVYLSSMPGQWLFPAAGLIVIALYSQPVMGRYRLKNLFFAKTVMSSFFFLWAIILSPVILRYGLSSPVIFDALRSGAVMFPISVCLAVLLDVRDVKGDAAAGIRTIPVLIGARQCSFFIAAAMALLCAYTAFHRDIYAASYCFTLALGSAFSAGKSRAYYEACLLGLNLVSAAALVLKIAAR
jgi:4-hydroxybenzoate polyprenyltransferase